MVERKHGQETVPRARLATQPGGGGPQRCANPVGQLRGTISMSTRTPEKNLVLFLSLQARAFLRRLRSITRFSFRASLLFFFYIFTTVRSEICFKYTGRKGWDGNQKSSPGMESDATLAMPMPALPEGFLARFDRSRSGKGGQSNKVGDALAVRTKRSAANAESRHRERAPAERPLVSERGASTSGSISAHYPDVGGAPESVFGGAFSPAAVSPPDKESLKAYAASVHAADSSALERGHDSTARAVVTTPKSEVPAAEPPISAPESYFIAYGHCLLAGAGTGASDEAEEAATAGGQSVAGDFGGASGRARVSRKNRARGYGDALEVFQEGLRRFPTSVTLLYGASLAMQARVWMCLKRTVALHAECFVVSWSCSTIP